MSLLVAPIWGSGVDTSLVISSNTTDAPIDAAFTGTSGTTTGSGTNASFAAGQAVLIHQTQGTGAGQYERNLITNYSSGTITFSNPLSYTYVTGAQILVLKQYGSIILQSGFTLSAKAWNGTVGGILAYVCSGRVVGPGNLSASAKGFRGGAGGVNTATGAQGESATGTGGQSSSANGAGGGGGTNLGGNGSAGGTTSDAADLSTLLFGGGGGGSNVPTGQSAVDGGDGGGAIILFGRVFDITGSITANGEVAGSGYRASGAGAGGSILLLGEQFIHLGSGLVIATGGAQASSSNGGGTGAGGGHATAGAAGSNTNGGAGGGGRIAIAKCRIDDAGTTNPTYTDRGYQLYCGGRG